jgi:hypothetical protein
MLMLGRQWCHLSSVFTVLVNAEAVKQKYNCCCVFCTVIFGAGEEMFLADLNLLGTTLFLIISLASQPCKPAMPVGSSFALQSLAYKKGWNTSCRVR